MKMQLLDWIDKSKLGWYYLSGNPNAIHLLEANLDEVHWDELSGNPNAIRLLEANLDEVDWDELSRNPNAIHLLEANQDKINWTNLSGNSNAIHLLETNLDKVDWIELIDMLYTTLNPNAIISLIEANFFEKNQDIYDDNDIYIDYLGSKIKIGDLLLRTLSDNACPNAIKILEQNKDYLLLNCWNELSSNPNAIHLLEANQNKINWDELSRNPNAIPLLKSNLDKINWLNLSKNPNAITLLEALVNYYNIFGEDVSLSTEFWKGLSKNPNAIHLLKENQDKIDWFNLSQNPNAIDLLEANPDKINWKMFIDMLNENENPNTILKAISLLEANVDKIEYWDEANLHSSALYLLEKRQDRIDWEKLSQNKNIFYELKSKIYLIYSNTQSETVFTTDEKKVFEIIEKMKQKYSSLNGEWNYKTIDEFV